MKAFHKAVFLAKVFHAEQLDKSGKPYYDHCLNVSAIVAEQGYDEDTQAAAILHDIVEDTPMSLDVLRWLGFSEKTVGIVKSVTRNGDPDSFRMETYKEFIRRVKQNPDAVPVKLADIQHNMSRLDTMDDQKEAVSLYKRYLWALKELKNDFPTR